MCHVYSKDEPPTMVEPRKWRIDSRYSASPRTDNRLWVVAENSPSTSFNFKPQSSSARPTPCAIRSKTERPSATWAKVGFRDPDNCRATAFEPFHHVLSAGAKTG